MAGPRRTRTITASILDRLIDDAPNEATDPPRNLSQDIDSLKQAVKRDLELLLNTRREVNEDLTGYDEARRSILGYGLPDFSALSFANDQDRVRIREEIETAIAYFEPRLSDVRVGVEAADTLLQRFSFRVDALLRVDPAPAPVIFDAQIDLATQQIHIRG